MDLLLSNTALDQNVKSPATNYEVIMNALMTLEEIRAGFEENFASWQAATSVSQHRKSHRLPFERPLLITPLDQESEVGAKLNATSRDISPDGISFISTEPLPYRRVLIEFPGTQVPRLISELTWCRFTRQQTHMCGGFFVGIQPDA